MTLSVTLPAVRAVTATVMLSPGAVLRLVERDLQQVGRVGARFRVPAGVEAIEVTGPLRSPLDTSSR